MKLWQLVIIVILIGLGISSLIILLIEIALRIN